MHGDLCLQRSVWEAEAGVSRGACWSATLAELKKGDPDLGIKRRKKKTGREQLTKILRLTSALTHTHFSEIEVTPPQRRLPGLLWCPTPHNPPLFPSSLVFTTFFNCLLFPGFFVHDPSLGVNGKF